MYTRVDACTAARVADRIVNRRVPRLHRAEQGPRRDEHQRADDSAERGSARVLFDPEWFDRAPNVSARDYDELVRRRCSAK